MSRKMLINASHPEENRVAIVVDGNLSELDIELAGQQQTKGNIYKAVVSRVEPGLQAAFIDYGAEKHGFLQLGELHPQLHPTRKASSKDRPRITDILHRGQEILVQVVKEQRGTKGAALTTYLSLPGRYMVLMPDSDTKGVSRKIQDDKERKALKKTMAQLDLPDEMGYIVRTAGIGKEKEELARDFNYLVSLYKGILARRDKVKAPAQLYQESDIVIRSIRDYFATDMDEVLIDDQKVYQQARDFFSLVMPDQLHLVKQHREKRPIFSRYQIEEQIESLGRNQVQLPSGGSIVIDQTEALVAIDVNSGRMAGEKGIEATAARSNIEAAAEIGRQLRLRDLGGLIVIDFIDMRDRKKVREVEQTLWQSVKDDKARITLGRISQFGLLEMSRQRIRPTLAIGASLECPHCLGKGRIKSPEAQGVALLRQLHAAVSKGQIGTIEARVPVDVANYLLNERRRALNDFEDRFDLRILIIGTIDALPGQVDLELLKREKPSKVMEDEAPVSHALGLEQAMAASYIEEGPEEVDDEVEPETPEVEAEEVANQETAEGEAGGKKRRRRRRRRRGGSIEAATETGETGEEATPEVEAVGSAADELTPAEAATTETAEKPKRRSRRGGRKKPGAGQVPEAAAAEAPTEIESAIQEAEVEALASPASTEEGEKPKRRSRRGGRKKPAADAETAAVEMTRAPEQAATPPEEKPAAAATATTTIETPEVPAKPKRRTPKKTSVQAPEATSAPGIEAVAEVSAEAEKAKRRTRKTPAKQTAAAAPEAPDAGTTEAKPQRGTRKPAAPKQTGETATEVPAAGATEKPKRQPRKKPTPQGEEPAAETAAAEKPRRTRRTGTTTKTEA